MLNIHDVHVNRFKREKRKYPIVLIISCNSSSYVIIRYQPFIDCFIHVKSYYVRNLFQSTNIFCRKCLIHYRMHNNIN